MKPHLGKAVALKPLISLFLEKSEIRSLRRVRRIPTGQYGP